MVLSLWLFCPAVGHAGGAAQPESFVFTNVTVIDATGADAKPDMTVVITGNRIAAVDRTGQVRIPEGAAVVDATGKFLIPGLWDMHVHALSEDRLGPYFALLLANGVTGVRDMGSPMSLPGISRVRGQIEAGKVQAPRIGAATGRILEGSQAGEWGSWTVFKVIRTPEEGAREVAALERDGADFVKVYNTLPRDVYFAIAAEAKKRGIPFVGHVPFAVSTPEAADAGQKSIEHLLEGILLIDCAARAATLRKELLAQGVVSDLSRVPDFYARVLTKAMDDYDEKAAAAVFRRFVRKGVWHVPTLTLGRTHPLRREDPIPDDSWLKYVPAPIQRDWDKYRGRDRKPEDFDFAERLWKKRLELVKSMNRAGVRILAGSDTGWGNEYTFPGFSLHDELALLVEAGLTPMESLQAATRNAAEFLNREKDLGTVERGKLADLVLLEADPLKEIKNTRKIAAVVYGGKMLSKQRLKEMVGGVEAAAYKK